MQNNHKLACAIAAILSSYSGVSRAAPAADTTDTSAIGEIIVTAQRRSQNLQDVPITMQALTGDRIGAAEHHNF